VSDADVSAAERLAAAAEKDEAIAATVLEEARASLGALDQRLAVVIAQLDGSTVEGVAASLATAQAALGEAQSAAATMATLAQEVEALAAQISTSATVIEGLLADEAAARADARAYDATVAEEADRHREQVGASASAAEALTDLRGRLAVIEDVQRARSAAAGHPVTVDPAAADATLAHAVTARSQAEAEHAAADEQRARLAHAHAALVTQSQELASARDQLDAIGSSTESAIQLGTLVTARSPANRRNLTLQSYSVQRRFQAVLEASSIHLERMSGGQFSFVIDDKASGRAQAGLGIDIHDAWTGQSRDPESLSGGETFYASLSLALGLADIVREEAGGVSLDTLFVDEGFGSLDADTLSVVLDQLDALRSRGRVVGVISHVAEMKEWVHDRIVVSPGAPGAGSRILQQA
jgi:exonuclease SbcC